MPLDLVQAANNVHQRDSINTPGVLIILLQVQHLAPNKDMYDMTTQKNNSVYGTQKNLGRQRCTLCYMHQTILFYR